MHSSIFKKISCTAGFLLLAGCGGLSGTDSATTRSITGSVPSASANISALTQSAVSDSCLADTIIATDTTGATTTALVDENCDFSIALSVDKSYVISLTLNDVFVATLVFDGGIDGFSSSGLPISNGSSTIDLGVLTISGSTATPANEPLDQNDQDGDGITDLNDTDDDNDGILDEDEQDCDLDGICDDHDEGNDSCDNHADDGAPRVLEVKPRNDPHPELGHDLVDIDRSVRARISCEVDQSTVTSETFLVESEAGEAVECEFSFSGHGAGDQIICDHAPFALDTVYTVTINGLKCSDSTDVTSRDWTWKTELTDSSSGDDFEDHFDDSIHHGDDDGTDDQGGANDDDEGGDDHHGGSGPH